MVTLLDEGCRVGGELCYMPSQCRDARIRSIEHDGLHALKLVTRIMYVWPGGYELRAITADGALLCAKCLRENYEQVYRSTRDWANDGWQVVGVMHSGEVDEGDDWTCAHCNA